MSEHIVWEPAHEYWLRNRYQEMRMQEFWKFMHGGQVPSPEEQKAEKEKINLEFKEKFPNIAL